MKYEAPKMSVIEIPAKNIIVTSGTIIGGDNTGNVGGGGKLED